MSKTGLISKYLVGNSNTSSHIEYKQAVLRGQLSLLLAGVGLFYLIIDPINKLYVYLPYYAGAIVIAILVIYLTRNGKHTIASIILVSFTNLLVFLIADASRPDSGVFFFFANMTLISLVLFYHNNLRLGLLFMAIPIFLGIIAYFNETPLLEPTILTGNTKHLNFIINLVLGIFTSVMVILFVISRNNESEASLTRNKENLELLTNQLKLKNEELLKANHELDSFVYRASHDMRAPLSTLLGLIEVAKMTNKPEEIPHYYELMTSRIHDMEGFIKEVTDYSRNTRLDVNVEKVNLRNIIFSIQESFDFLAKDSSIKIELNVPEDLDIQTDSTRLKVVLNNLFVNAIKYYDPRKELRFVKIAAEERDGSCFIMIEDNGIGIPEQYHAKIFDMFFRASAKATGSGLGLYIVHETLEKLNGSIDFESTPLKGSKFIVELPLILIPYQESA